MRLELGLTGYPLTHSRSPAIHAAGLRACRLSGAYRLYPIEPLPEGAAELARLLERLRVGELHGLNVTIPHKQSVLPYLDAQTPTAQAIGAVNTLYSQDGKLVGENTDAQGFLKDLAARGLNQPGAALVLGAGGAARAAVYGLLAAGWTVTVAARRVEQAEGAIHEWDANTRMSDSRTAALRLTAEALAGLRPGLVVNATPAGMAPDMGGSPWPEGLPLPGGAFVYDMVYAPAQTRLMRQAMAAGLPCANGLGMLVEQAALAFERWTGREAPREAMRYGAELEVA